MYFASTSGFTRRAKYKALGRGYTGIMADVLNYVADNPEILSKVH